MAHEDKSPAPQWGKINDGQFWRPITVDIGRALFGVSWPAHCLPLIFRVIEGSWAPFAENGKRAEASPAAINFNALATEWGIPRQRLFEAKTFLVANRVLIVRGDGYLFNKRADQWGGKQPLLKPAMLAYAVEGMTKQGDDSPQKDVTPQSDTPTIDNDESVTPQRYSVSRPSVTACHAPALQRVTPQSDTEAVPPDPYSGTTRGIEIRDQLDPARGGEPPSAEIPIEGSDQTRRHRLIAQAEAFRPMEGASSKIDGFLAGYSLEWVETAFMSASLLDKPGNIWRYMHKCLLAYKAQGGTVDPASIRKAELAQAEEDRRPKPTRFKATREEYEWIKEVYANSAKRRGIVN